MNLKASQDFGFYYRRLPLEKSATIRQGNALDMDWNEVIPVERVDYILGNPPFVGAKFMDKSQRADMARVWHGVKSAGVLDYVTGWYAKAAQYLRGDGELQRFLDELPGAPPPRERVKIAFVSTNSISQGEQVGVLWSELFRLGAKIHFAHRTFQWSSEAPGKAAVHCVIVGWALFDTNEKRLFEYSDIKGDPQESAAANLNPYLVDAPDVLIERRGTPLCAVPEIRFGNQPIDGGNFLLDESEKAALLQCEPEAADYIHPFVGSEELINNELRYCLWLQDIDPSKLKRMAAVKERVAAVRDFREQSIRAATRKLAETPTRFAFISQPDTPFLAIPSVSSERRQYIPMAIFEPSVIASNLCLIIPDATRYHFGVLSSAMHMAWVRYVAGRLKSDYRYSNQIVYNNYPWPEEPNVQRREAIETAAEAVLAAREKFPDASLADLYDPVTMPPVLREAHAKLDRAVDAAYGRRTFASDAERVAFLFDLYNRATSLLPAAPQPKPKRPRKRRPA